MDNAFRDLRLVAKRYSILSGHLNGLAWLVGVWGVADQCRAWFNWMMVFWGDCFSELFVLYICRVHCEFVIC